MTTLTWVEWIKEQERNVIPTPVPEYVELCRMYIPPMYANEYFKFRVTGKKVMRNAEGQELKRVKSGKIKPGRYYTDKHNKDPVEWVIGPYIYKNTKEYEFTKVWKVKK